jgi:uncharacterized protein
MDHPHHPYATIGPRPAAVRAAAVALAVAVAVAWWWPQQAAGQSFDCFAAGTPVETAICSDFTLSGLDAQMAGLYERVVNYATSATRSEIMVEQTRWLASRDRCGTNRDCLLGEYRARIMGLGMWWQRLGLPS